MGTTTANGVIKKVPYGLLKNVNQTLQPVTVLIFDSTGNPRQPGSGAGWPIHRDVLNSGIPFYLNDTLKLIYRGPNRSGSERLCDLYRVNPSTGVESLDSQVALDKPLRRGVNIAITAIDGSTGALTKVVSYAD